MRNGMQRFAAGFMSLALAVGLVPAPAFASAGEAASGFVAATARFAPQALPVPSYGWYTANPDAGSFTIEKVQEFMGFANLVNGTADTDGDGKAEPAVSFAGKDVNVSYSGTFNLGDCADGKWQPIGDASHPFEGAFHGNGVTVNNFSVNGTNRAAYLGLFGYVGAQGSVSNVKVGSSAAITATRAASSKDALHHIGGVAGYCAGSMSNCTNNAKVTVTTAVVQTASAHQVAWAVGGVAGECKGAMSECANNAVAAVTVRATSVPVAAIGDSGLVRYVGGVAGVSGDSARIGTSSNPIASDGSAGGMQGCVNLAPVTVDTPSTAGKDRFGETAYARGVCVGGVVGYAQGNVSDCKNGLATSSHLSSSTASIGYVRAEHSTAVGGIAGSLRATPSSSDNNTGRPSADDGSAGEHPEDTAIELASCTNYGDVYALNAVGGIVGSAGSYTTVIGCLNAKRASDTFIVATRWNKPAPAGVAGMTSGDVAYCANFATVASGTWKSESARTLENGAGYYASGIVGMLSYFMEATSAGSAVRTTPVPEVRGCYNAGAIMAVSGMRQRGLVGDNGGYVHGNVLLSGTVEKNLLTYTDGSGGTEENNEVLAAAELRGKDAIATLNGACYVDGWEAWWAPSDGTENLGYPVLRNPSSPEDGIDLSSFTARLEGGAPYTGGTGTSAAIPAIRVEDESHSALIPNVDYRIVPHADAKDIGGPYKAKVEGIGDYKGSISDVEYSIVRGDLSSCTVSVEPVTFDFDEHYPSKSMVTVRNAGGVTVDPGEYEVTGLVRKDATGATAQAFADEAGKRPVNASSNYFVTLSVASSSEHFERGGSVEGRFHINAADLQRDADYSRATISFNGTTYPWVSSGDEANVDKPKTTLPYTGSAVKPAVSGITYNGRTLVSGKDFLTIYGNPNSTANGGISNDANNSGNAAGTSVGCVTVRFLANKANNYQSNFTSYQNMFFNITNGLAKATVTGLGDQKYTGSEIKPALTVKVGSTTLRAGTDYTVAFKNNKAIGTATATITGRGGYGGVKTASFKIVKRSNTLSAKAKKPTVSYKKLKKKAQTLALSKAIAVKGAQGKVTYKKKSGNKKITVASKNGKITIKKGLKKGSYTLKIQVSAAGGATYAPAAKLVSVKLKVK